MSPNPPTQPEIDPQMLIRLAALARLELPTSRVAELTSQLGRLVAAFADLAAADFGGVHEIPPTPGALATPLRDDEPGTPLRPEQALANAPRQANDCFVVPRVIDA